MAGPLDHLKIPVMGTQGRCAPAKPERGTAKFARQSARDKVEKAIDANIALIKKLDGKCRLPFCPWCAAFDHQLQHGAHVMGNRGMGGDLALEVSQPEHLMRLCALSHASQEKNEWEPEPLTEAGTRGPCAFYIVRDVYEPETSHYSTERVLWATEKAVGLPESAAPLTAWDPIRRMRPVD